MGLDIDIENDKVLVEENVSQCGIKWSYDVSNENSNIDNEIKSDEEDSKIEDNSDNISDNIQHWWHQKKCGGNYWWQS